MFVKYTMRSIKVSCAIIKYVHDVIKLKKNINRTPNTLYKLQFLYLHETYYIMINYVSKVRNIIIRIINCINTK